MDWIDLHTVRTCTPGQDACGLLVAVKPQVRGHRLEVVAAVLGYLGGTKTQKWVAHNRIWFGSQDMTTLASIFFSNPHYSPARRERQETTPNL